MRNVLGTAAHSLGEIVNDNASFAPLALVSVPTRTTIAEAIADCHKAYSELFGGGTRRRGRTPCARPAPSVTAALPPAPRTASSQPRGLVTTYPGKDVRNEKASNRQESLLRGPKLPWRSDAGD